MTDWSPFPDLEAAVIELLSDLLAPGGLAYANGFTLGSYFGDNGMTCDVVTPSDLAKRSPFIRVTRSGGTDDRITDTARIDLDFFALKRTDAGTLARAGHQRMLSFPHSLTDCVIDRVVTATSPTSVPWSDTFVRLFTAAYEVTARRTFVSV